MALIVDGHSSFAHEIALAASPNKSCRFCRVLLARMATFASDSTKSNGGIASCERTRPRSRYETIRGGVGFRDRRRPVFIGTQNPKPTYSVRGKATGNLIPCVGQKVALLSKVLDRDYPAVTCTGNLGPKTWSRHQSGVTGEAQPVKSSCLRWRRKSYDRPDVKPANISPST